MVNEYTSLAKVGLLGLVFPVSKTSSGAIQRAVPPRLDPNSPDQWSPAKTDMPKSPIFTTPWAVINTLDYLNNIQYQQNHYEYQNTYSFEVSVNNLGPGVQICHTKRNLPQLPCDMRRFIRRKHEYRTYPFHFLLHRRRLLTPPQVVYNSTPPKINWNHTQLRLIGPRGLFYPNEFDNIRMG